MRRILLYCLALIALRGHAAHAANCSIASGASESSLKATIASCASGSTATFAAGTYTITSPIAPPCGVSLSGPAVPISIYAPGDGHTRLGFTPTATIQGDLLGSQLVTANTCGTPATITFLGFNGEMPSPDGGGGIYLPGNTSNLTIEYNYFYGNQTINTKDGNSQDSFIWLGDTNPGNNDQNITIQWNRFGATGNCSNIMGDWSSSTYRGGSANSFGGYCAAVGIHAGATNLLIANNDIYYQEEGIKDYTGTSSSNFCNNCQFLNNTFSNIHRMGIESQIAPNPPELISGNVFISPFVPFYGTFAISNANGSGTYSTHVTNNLLIDDVSPICCGQAANEYTAEANESWGYLSTSINNTIQGYWANGVVNSWPDNSIIENNAFCGQGTPPGDTYSQLGMQYVSNNGTTNTPTVSGNTPSAANTVAARGSTSCSQQASTAPTISPGAGAQTFPLTVTLTDPGNTSSTGVTGNTSVWYTTDGSTPVPGSGTAVYYTGPFTIPAAGTVKAVGMYGSENQPTTHPAGYGFAPSSVVSAVYTGGGARSVTSVVLTTGSSLTALHVGATNQAAALCKYSDGSSDNCTASGNTVTWVSSAPATATISSSGLITAVANGTTSFTAAAGGQTSAAVPLTVSTLSSITITAASTSLHTAATDQFTATCVYANGYSDGCNTVDLHGYTAGWTSGTPATGTISASGLLTAVGAGTTAVHASIGGVSSSSITVTVTAPTLSSIALATTGSVTSIPVYVSNQIIATCTYSDSSSGPCSPTSWTSSVPASATINSSGVVTAVAVGATMITAAIGAVTSPSLALTIAASTATLTGGHLGNAGSINTMSVGGTVQFSPTCNYSDGTLDDCTRAGGVIGWASNNPSVMSMSSLGLATGLALGSANAKAIVNSTKLNPWTMTINNTVTLTGATIQLFGGATTIPLGAMIQATVTCQYSDSSTTTCSGTADSHGNLATTYTSSSTGVATINSTGLVTPVGSGSTTFGATVGSFTPSVTVFVSAGIAFGQSSTDTTGTTSNNALKGDYVLTGSNTSGYSVASCSMFLPTGTVTSGDHIDCGITLAPTATTQASSALCHATYTQPSASAPNDWVTIPLTGCGTLSPNTAYWVWRQTDDPLTTNVGFWDCGSNCTGTAPTAPGPGNFTSYYALNTYGTYTGMTTTMSTGGAGFQQSIYATLSAAPPTLVSAYQANSGSVNQLQIYGKPIQQHAMCTYSDSVSLDCTNGDSRGSSVTAWSSAFSPVLSIGAVGSSTPGLVSPVNPGYTYTSCTVTGGIACSPWYWTVIFPPRTGFTFPGMTLSGVTVH